jgi:type VI secretion system protein ImpK
VNDGLIERRAAPSLLGPREAKAGAGQRGAAGLLDLLHQGFYLLFMLKNGAAPPPCEVFGDKILRYLDEFDRKAQQMRAEPADIEAAKYAYCATLDEIVLAAHFPQWQEWERTPLQLRVFGDQLAGEHFFDRLEELRSKSRHHLQALQVFHMCLLLGFHGKYALDTSDKLAYLSARLGDEIAHIKGKSRGFAPRAARPDQVVNRVGGDVPLWVLSTLFALAAALAFGGLKMSLTRATLNGLAPYADLVKLAPRPAHLTITLP